MLSNMMHPSSIQMPKPDGLACAPSLVAYVVRLGETPQKHPLTNTIIEEVKRITIDLLIVTNITLILSPLLLVMTAINWPFLDNPLYLGNFSDQKSIWVLWGLPLMMVLVLLGAELFSERLLVVPGPAVDQPLDDMARAEISRRS